MARTMSRSRTAKTLRNRAAKGRARKGAAASRAKSRSAKSRNVKAERIKSRARVVTRSKPKAPSKQTFNVSHFREGDFRNDGLRSYATYRDLGMSQATGGRLQAHVIRMIPPCDPAEVSKRHFHDVELQMIYVLKGWMKGEYEGQVVMLREGSAWLQPPRIKHTVLDYSDDCELLEIIVPAEFDTVEVDNITVE